MRKKTACKKTSGFLDGRSGGTRTRGLLVPNQAHYQTVPHPDSPTIISKRRAFVNRLRSILPLFFKKMRQKDFAVKKSKGRARGGGACSKAAGIFFKRAGLCQKENCGIIDEEKRKSVLAFSQIYKRCGLRRSRKINGGERALAWGNLKNPFRSVFA